MTAPAVEGNAQYLTSIYGGNVRDTYSSALKGYLTEMSREQAAALSQDSNVLFVEEDQPRKRSQPLEKPISVDTCTYRSPIKGAFVDISAAFGHRSVRFRADRVAERNTGRKPKVGSDAGSA